jgi:CheY-like chemotaxis protein
MTPVIHKAHVLIVDDHETIRTAMRFMLEDAGYQVLEAPDGHAGWEALIACPQRLVVLLDLAMPGMDGMTVLEKLHRLPSLAARHTVVVVSAYADGHLPARLVELADALAVQIVGKPFTLDGLLAAVSQAERRLASPPAS